MTQILSHLRNATQHAEGHILSSRPYTVFGFALLAMRALILLGSFPLRYRSVGCKSLTLSLESQCELPGMLCQTGFFAPDRGCDNFSVRDCSDCKRVSVQAALSSASSSRRVRGSLPRSQLSRYETIRQFAPKDLHIKGRCPRTPLIG